MNKRAKLMNKHASLMDKCKTEMVEKAIKSGNSAAKKDENRRVFGK